MNIAQQAARYIRAAQDFAHRSPVLMRPAEALTVVTQGFAADDPAVTQAREALHTAETASTYDLAVGLLVADMVQTGHTA